MARGFGRRSSSRDRASTRGWDEFAPLYDEHHQRLYRVALLLTHGDSARAEDAVAETFIKVYEIWSGHEIEHFMAYARRTLVNHLMSQARADKVASRYLATQRGDGRGARPIDDVVSDTSEVFQALAALPPRQRTAMVLRFYEDLPYEQIASIMDVSIGTVKAQVSVGLQRLRLVMDQRAVSDELA